MKCCIFFKCKNANVPEVGAKVFLDGMILVTRSQKKNNLLGLGNGCSGMLQLQRKRKQQLWKDETIVTATFALVDIKAFIVYAVVNVLWEDYRISQE